MAREAMDICLRVLKERNKSRFDSCSDHIPYYLSGLSPAHFSDNLSRNSYIRQLVKSPPPPFHIPEAWKSYPFGLSLPAKAIIGSTPPGDFHYLKEKLHVYTINDIQLFKMYRLSCKSPGEQKHPRLEGWEFKNSLTEKKHGTVIFLTLRQWTAASTKPDFCFLLSLMATCDYY